MSYPIQFDLWSLALYIVGILSIAPAHSLLCFHYTTVYLCVESFCSLVLEIFTSPCRFRKEHEVPLKSCIARHTNGCDSRGKILVRDQH